MESNAQAFVLETLWVVDLDTGEKLFPALAGGSGLFGGGGGSTPKPPSPEHISRYATNLTGRTAEDMKENLAIADEIIGYLRQQGMAADDAFVIQQSLISARGDQLSSLVQNLSATANAMATGMIQPQELKHLGTLLNQNIMQQVASGNPDLQKAFNLTEQQGIESIPSLRQSVEELQTMGRGLGEFDQDRFDIRFKPALERLNQAFDERQSGIIKNMNARGIRAGSGPEAHQNKLLAREYSQAATDAALRAQAEAQGQELAEYNARQNEPANILRIRADQREGAGQLMQRHAQGVNEAATAVGLKGAGADASLRAYQTRAGIEAPMASERRDQTMGEALRQHSLPTSQAAAVRSGVAPAALSSAAQTGAAKLGSDANRYGTSMGAITNIGGAAMGAAAAFSDVNKKEGFEPVEDEEALGAIRRIPISEYEYKPETGLDDGQRHIGGMAQDMPDEVTDPAKTQYDMQDYIGVLTGAIRALDKRLERMGV